MYVIKDPQPPTDLSAFLFRLPSTSTDCAWGGGSVIGSCTSPTPVESRAATATR